jgi:hypothetical protein
MFLANEKRREMMYKQGDLHGENESGIFEAGVDFVEENSNTWHSKVVVYGNSAQDVVETSARIIDELNGTDVGEQVPDYAAAFNMWMDQYTNDPSSFESSYDTAMRHVSEKLNGREPSYGVVAAQLFQEYLNKVQEGK